MLTIYGASDDLIEVEGDITAEFTYRNDGDQGDLLALSDGTVLRIKFDSNGVWRITPVVDDGALSIWQCPEDDAEDRYSDRAQLSASITWVVHGINHATW